MADNNQNNGNEQTNIDDILSHNDVEVEVEDSFNTEIETEESFNTEDSFNDVLSNNDVEVEVEIEDSFNSNSQNEDSYNTNSQNEIEIEVEDSFNTDNSIEDSYNDNSENFLSNNDVEIENENSFNDNSDNSIRNQDSFNVTSSFNTQTLNDDSTTVGVRQYQASFGEFNVGGLFGGAGKAGAGFGGSGLDISIDNRSVQADQSINQAISTGHGGDVNQIFGQNMNIAAGDGSVAGNNVFIDESYTKMTFDDISIGNTEINTRINDSFNDFSENYDVEVEFEFEDSFNTANDYTEINFEADDSFNYDQEFDNNIDWQNTGNIFSDGSTAGTGDDVVF